MKEYRRSIQEATQDIQSRINKETTTELSTFNVNYSPQFNSIVGDRIILVIPNADTGTLWNVMSVVTQTTENNFTYAGVWAEDSDIKF